MKLNPGIKSWLLVTLVVAFVSACTTTQEELSAGGDGAPVLDESQSGSSAIADGSSGSDGAEATGLDGADGGDGTAIVDYGAMTAMEQLNRTDGELADRTIYFEYDSAKLTSESIAILETHGNFIAGNGEVKVRLEGHGDERGSREYNIALGERRANSVRQLMTFLGANSAQIRVVSYGEERPVVDDHDESAWAANRRVEIIYLNR